MIGATSETHAAKLPAWSLRLRIAAKLLDAAVRRRDRAAVVDQLADVWFWQGRILCDAMSATDVPAHRREAAQAIAAMLAARGPLSRGRAFLLELRGRATTTAR